jgi:hypothetical protein
MVYDSNELEISALHVAYAWPVKYTNFGVMLISKIMGRLVLSGGVCSRYTRVEATSFLSFFFFFQRFFHSHW